jgi:hypothetical protein
MTTTYQSIATGITMTLGGSPFVFEIIDVTPPPGTREKVKTTHQGTRSTQHAHTYLPSRLADWGEAKFECIYDPSIDPHGASKGFFDEDTPVAMVITYPDGSTWTWAASNGGGAFVTSFEPTGTLEELEKVSIGISVSGQPTVA